MSKIDELLGKITKNNKPNEDEISLLMNKIDFNIDQDYLNFIKLHDGAEGFIGESSYILLWGVGDLLSLNPYYEEAIDDGYSGSVFLFGSNGGDTAYGIKKAGGIFFEAPFIGMSNDTSILRGNNFTEFLSFLSNQ